MWCKMYVYFAFNKLKHFCTNAAIFVNKNKKNFTNIFVSMLLRNLRCKNSQLISPVE